MIKILWIILVLIFSLLISGNVFGEENIIVDSSIIYENPKLINVEILSDDNFSSLKWEISWKILNNDLFDKIEIIFKNEDSNYPIDIYTLNSYKKWDISFKYLLYNNYKNLDYWKNIYTINAYEWDNITTIKININIKKEFFVEWDNNISKNIIKIKSQKLVVKDFILSKRDLEKTFKWKKNKVNIDNIILKLSDKKLVSVYNKLEKLDLNSKKIKRYKNILKYLQSKIWLEIWKKDWIKKEVIKNVISYKDNYNEFIKYNTDLNSSWWHESTEKRELDDIKILKTIWDFKLISYWFTWYDNVNSFKFKYQNSVWEKYYLIFDWEYSSYEPDIYKYKRYKKILNSNLSYINFNNNDWIESSIDLLFKEEYSKLYTFLNK